MAPPSDSDDIEVSDLKMGKASYSETLYFTGGIVGIPAPGGGVHLTPVRGENEILAVPDISWQRFQELAAQCGSRFVGSNQTISGTGAAPVEVWRPSFSPPKDKLGGSDSWAAISHQAHLKGDFQYEDVARAFSHSMHSSGIRLRNVARAHNEQLCWAFGDNRKPGSGFSNVALFDLYGEFQALVTELCSARDHLAHAAAIEVGAKDSIESMARLEEWIRRPANAKAAQNPLALLLLAQWGTKAGPGWLQKLGELRNRFVHKQPMAGNPDMRMLRLVSSETAAGTLETIRLSPLKEDGEIKTTPDPFITILDFYNVMEKLARAASDMARYPPKLLNFVAK